MGHKVPNFETSGCGWTNPARLIRTPVPLTRMCEYMSTITMLSILPNYYCCYYHYFKPNLFVVISYCFVSGLALVFIFFYILSKCHVISLLLYCLSSGIITLLIHSQSVHKELNVLYYTGNLKFVRGAFKF